MKQKLKQNRENLNIRVNVRPDCREWGIESAKLQRMYHVLHKAIKGHKAIQIARIQKLLCRFQGVPFCDWYPSQKDNRK